jgi:hypothetical protein
MANNSHFPSHFDHTRGPYRHRPAEWCPMRRQWIQDGRILRDVKASKAFVWPKDGKNGTTWGRFKDILTNKGPDIYLTMSADKNDRVHNRPTRGTWSGHRNLDPLSFESSYRFSSQKNAPWTKKGILGGRMPGMSYDFRTRNYQVPHARMWTDAVWQPDPRKNKRNLYPEAIRNIYGEWFQDRHYLPQYFGGPVDNERGEGRIGRHLEAVRYL